MFKGHPKGLIIASIANMGERFGFYTMMAILVFFLQSRYGMSVEESGDVYSWFYFGIYGMALVGGIMADRYTGLGRTILAGIVTMLLGYLLLTFPITNRTITFAGLAIIALGNGLFKGNLQALVGNLYENETYGKLRDSAFSIFYMCINIGAFFAPSAAEAMLNFILKGSGFAYNGQLPALCHDYLNQSSNLDINRFQELANKASLTPITDYSHFASSYLESVSTGYNYAFGVAAFAMTISLLVFVLCRKYLAPGDYNAKTAKANGNTIEEISPKETRKRLTALGLVFFVVIFFWMSFHQNGLTLNQFAKDYTASNVSAFTNMFFNLGAFLSVIAMVAGIVILLRRKKKGAGSSLTENATVGNKNSKNMIWGAILAIAGLGASYYFYNSFGAENPINPAKFQQFNPVFIVFLTPLVVGFFAWLNSKGKEPSTPRKIGYGMIIAAIGFVIMIFASAGLTAPSHLAAEGTSFASPYWLISTYFTLTIAELCLSPMGISFVSKVAPPKYKGLMQGCWLGATAIGNKLLIVGSYFWERLELWQLWSIFVVCCIASALIIFALMKRLEAVAK